MYSDYHIHSMFSADSSEQPDSIIEKAISLGMDEICFTDHNDFNWPVPGENFDLDVSSYIEYMNKLKSKYSSKIDIGIGIECGITPTDYELNNKLISENSFDFVIGSCHIVEGLDPYYPEFYEGKTDKEALSLYFNEIKKSIDNFDNFDVLGHMDYVIRYSPYSEKKYNIEDYADLVDYILKKLILSGKGIEINTSGLKSGLSFANPNPQILKRYRELGGEIITIGSDAHQSQFVGYEFEKVKGFLNQAGFKYYCIFKNRKPTFKKI